MSARHFTVTGHVQGVFFRAETQKKAQELHVTGWVRNCEDDSVEVHAEGTDELLLALESWLHRGPPSARVERVESEEVAPENGGEFSIIN
jgi:acylphosphatase